MALPLNVLIIEDLEDDAVLLTRVLRKGGFEPLVARVRGIIRPSQNKTQNNSGGTAGTTAVVEPMFNEKGDASDERLEPKLATESGGGA